jgi:PAS domain S-box-containing protein
MERNSQPAEETATSQHACPYYPLPGASITGACEPHQTLRAIRAGEVDALVVARDGQERVYALEGAETPYRTLVEQMEEGALTVSAVGTILYANSYFADLLNVPLEQVIGASLLSFVSDPTALMEFVADLQRGPARCEFELLRSGNGLIPAYVSGRRLPWQEEGRFCLVITDLTEQKWVEELRAAEAALRDSNQRLELLMDVVGELLRNPDPREIVHDLATKVMRFLDCDAFFNYFLDSHTGRLHLNACEGVPAEIAQQIEWLDLGAAVCGCAARDGVPMVEEYLAENPKPRTELVRSLGIRAYACHPLKAGERVIGTLSFGRRARDYFGPDDLAVMRAVTDHIAIAVERIQFQQALSASKERLQSTLSSITDAYFALDDEWRFLEINLVAQHTIFKRPPEELLGKAYLDEYPAARGNHFTQQLRLATQSRVPVHFESRSAIAGRWFEAHAYPYEDRLDVYLRDITERKESELALVASQEQAREEAARLQAVLDAAPAVIWIAHDRDCQTITGNSAAYQFLRMGAGQNMSKSAPDLQQVAHFRILKNGTELRPSELPIQRVAASGEALSDFELDVAFNDGDQRSLLGKVVPVFDAAGEPDGAIAAFVDVTEIKQWEVEREALLDSERAARGEAERANQLKDEFLANLSHELRTPLTAVLGWVQLLQRGKLNEDEQREAINIIDRNSRLQAQLISDLLDMSRVLSGKLRLEMQRVQIIPVAEAALASVLPQAEEKGVRLARTLENVGPVHGDPTRLQQVIWNLLSNAVKFTPAEGCVHLRISEVDGHVEVAVSDTGVGIAPEFLPHVFERFRQADGSFTRHQGGLGLGLSIVKQLTDMHGGTVHVFSEGDNRGTTFTVRLPRMPAPGEREAGRAPGTEHGNGHDEVDLAGTRVLVVDDDPVARDLLGRLLLECKAEVMAAGSGPEALQMVGTAIPHVVLSDIGMPGQDGYQFLRELRKLPPERGGAVPMVAVTAYARPEDRSRSIAAGFQAHISKPIDRSELLSVIAGLRSG